MESSNNNPEKSFFLNLNNWVKDFNKINFIGDEKKKSHIIIDLINKFIFLQTLDNLKVIKKDFIKNLWLITEDKWKLEGKFAVLQNFLHIINESFHVFYKIYESRKNLEDNIIIKELESSENNIQRFYETLKKIIGMEISEIKSKSGYGIIQLDYKKINIDILAKSYEKHVAEIKKEKGIFYTKEIVTDYMVSKLITSKFRTILCEIEESLKIEDWKRLKNKILDFISIKILDPACGSGSFLIKVFEKIWGEYKELNDILNKKMPNIMEINKNQDRITDLKIKKITSVKKLVGFVNTENLHSKIILRHIFGTDLDKNALEILKIGIWLVAIRLNPESFKIDNNNYEISDNNYKNPNFGLNFIQGDSLIGFPVNRTLKLIQNEFSEELKQLFVLRNRYLQNPKDILLNERIFQIKNEIEIRILNKFKEYLLEKKINIEICEETKPLHWGNDFWHVFFEEIVFVERGKNKNSPDLSIKQKDNQGFDIIIGNPPYERAHLLKHFKNFYKKHYKTWYGVCDIYIPFIERSINLLKNGGELSFITSNKYLIADYGKKLRKLLLNYSIMELIDLTECPSVFENALISPLITHLQKMKTKTNAQTKIIIFKTDAPELLSKIHNMSIKKVCSVEFRNQQNLQNKITGHYNIYVRNELRMIIDKIYEGSLLYKDICEDLRTGIMGFNYNSMEEIIYDSEVPNDIQDLELISPSLISQYEIMWSKKEIQLFKKKFSHPRIKYNPDLVNKQTWILFKKPKVIFRGTATKLEAALDKKGRAILVAVHAAISDRIPPFYQLCLLNSLLFNWLHIIVYYSARIPQGSLRYPISFYENLPIRIREEYKNIFKHLAARIITLKEIYTKYLYFWNEIIVEKRKGVLPLYELLIQDREKNKEGHLEKVFTKNCTIYPDEKTDLLNINYDEIKINPKGKKTLLINGIKNLNENEILSIETHEQNIRNLLFVEIELRLRSKIKVKSLNDVFLKTTVSNIKRNHRKKDSNLLILVNKKFQNWLNNEDIQGYPNEIDSIFNDIRKTQNIINAHVFLLYDLTEKEIKKILKTLKSTDLFQKRIINEYNNLKHQPNKNINI